MDHSVFMRKAWGSVNLPLAMISTVTYRGGLLIRGIHIFCLKVEGCRSQVVLEEDQSPGPLCPHGSLESMLFQEEVLASPAEQKCY